MDIELRVEKLERKIASIHKAVMGLISVIEIILDKNGISDNEELENIYSDLDSDSNSD